MFKFLFACFAAVGAAGCTGVFFDSPGLAFFLAGVAFVGVLAG